MNQVIKLMFLIYYISVIIISDKNSVIAFNDVVDCMKLSELFFVTIRALIGLFFWSSFRF